MAATAKICAFTGRAVITQNDGSFYFIDLDRPNMVQITTTAVNVDEWLLHPDGDIPEEDRDPGEAPYLQFRVSLDLSRRKAKSRRYFFMSMDTRLPDPARLEMNALLETLLNDEEVFKWFQRILTTLECPAYVNPALGFQIGRVGVLVQIALQRWAKR